MGEMTERTIGGVAFRVDEEPGGSPTGRLTHTAVLVNATPWADVVALIGAVVPGLGTISDLVIRRAGLASMLPSAAFDPVPAGWGLVLVVDPE